MKLIIIGTDHTMQDSDVDLKDFISRITESEQITLIGEEHLFGPVSVAQEVALSKGIRWVQIDMPYEERIKAGICDKLFNRMQVRFDEHGRVFQPLRYAPEEDGLREQFWLNKIAGQQDGEVALVVCGAIHARKVAEKAEQKGHATKLFFFPEIPGSEFWVSIIPELF
jgi:hypothetical protein